MSRASLTARNRTRPARLLPYGPDAATVEVVAGQGLWFTEVRPVRKAASIDLAFDTVDQLFVTVGRRSFEKFPFGLDDLGYLNDILEGIFAGTVEEAGFRSNSFACINTSGGIISVGALHLPIPRRLWPVRHYHAYGDRTDRQASGLPV
jgi:hypothetical protein